MAQSTIDRPAATEYAPYYERYISRVPDGDLIELLERQLEDTLALLRAVPEERADARYAPGKWSIKEVVGHLSDTERVFAYRALRIARNDPTPLPGFDQDEYVRHGGFDARTLADLAAEFSAVRRATMDVFRYLDRDALSRRGVANGAEVSVRALAYIIAGHERHHGEVLRTRYLTRE